MRSAHIAALAGRRIDEPGAGSVRFPTTSIAAVSSGIVALLKETAIDRLICSAACGADLLAIEAAKRLAIPVTIVLPFDARAFRETSVTDRPGDWGPRFDKAIRDARGRDALVDLDLDREDATAYDQATARIISATAMLPAARRFGIVVWEGRPRGSDDASADFRDRARAAGFELREVLTTG